MKIRLLVLVPSDRACQESGIVLFEVLDQAVHIAGRQNIVQNEILTQLVLLRTLVHEQGVHLENSEQAQLNGFFTEQPRPQVCAGYFPASFDAQPSPAQGDVSDGRALFSLPHECIDQLIERNFSAIVQILADLECAKRDAALVVCALAAGR